MMGYPYKDSWVNALNGKRVLIISPFINSLRIQYEKRNIVSGYPFSILPEFMPIWYKAINSVKGEKPPYKTWKLCLEKMEHDISHLDFDIALVSCGAYGFPLCSFIKNMGKQSIYMGSYMLCLFGINFNRIKNNEYIQQFVNENWIKLSKEERPTLYKDIEGGCYW